MARSRTRKKFAKKETVYVPPEISKEIDQTAQRIKRFANRELNTLQQNQTPLCIPVDGGYRIGNYRLRCFPNKSCEVWEDGRYLVHTFLEKVSAVLYTIYLIKHNINLAHELRHLDETINKNYTDIMYLRRAAIAAEKRGDYGIADTRRARIDLAERRLREAQANLARMHRVAKANKVWE